MVACTLQSVSTRRERSHPKPNSGAQSDALLTLRRALSPEPPVLPTRPPTLIPVILIRNKNEDLLLLIVIIIILLLAVYCYYYYHYQYHYYYYY